MEIHPRSLVSDCFSSLQHIIKLTLQGKN